MAAASFVDYYDLLNVGPNAPIELIEASVRLLLQRYVPQSKQGGDSSKLDMVKAAYMMLLDPQARADYDQEYTLRCRTSISAETDVITPESVLIERRRRLRIVKVLYQHLLQDSHAPGLNTIAISSGVGAPAEQLRFSVWFLNEKGLISRTDQGNYCITAEGAEWLEENSLSSQTAELLPSKPPVAEASLVRPVSSPQYAVTAAAGGDEADVPESLLATRENSA